MVSAMWRILFIAFLLAHGGVHLVMWLSPIDPDACVQRKPLLAGW
jgi:hypothetical protein